jgi:cytochrome oxidase Cu insertion factor (SCO1/SenC/PrrC family)
VKRRPLRTGAAGAAAALALFTLAAGTFAHEPPVVPDPPAVMDFVPPAPGTYRLYDIMPAPDGAVLDLEGRRARLARFTTGKITVLSFIYTSCADARGCPLAYQAFHTMHDRLRDTPGLRDRVRLVTLSFDPARDTPAAMRRYAEGAIAERAPGIEWTFLTTGSLRELLPILDGFGQDVQVERRPRAGQVARLSHVLKVFLIDPRGMVREIYTTAYLFPEVVLNDIETLRRE